MHVGDYLGRRTLYTPDRLAIVDHGKSPTLRLTFRELNERANRLANWLRTEAGIARGDRVIAYCGGGISATIDLFQLHRLGYDHITLYDGSMGEWARDESLPIETG